MLQYIPLAVAFIGSSVAAAWDLKTTEIPDKIPYIMMVIGLIYFGVQSYLEWNYWPVLLSATSGLSLLGLGFLLYYFGQWGVEMRKYYLPWDFYCQQTNKDLLKQYCPFQQVIS